MSARLGARLRLQAEHRFYADVELGLNRMDSNTVSKNVGGPSGRAFRWYVTTDSTQYMNAFPVALSVHGNYVQEGFAISEFGGTERDWDAYALRNEWDLDSALLKGDLRYDELALRIRLGKDWFGTAKWGYRRGDEERWNTSRSQFSLVHRGLDAASEFTAAYVSSSQKVEQIREHSLRNFCADSLGRLAVAMCAILCAIRLATRRSAVMQRLLLVLH